MKNPRELNSYGGALISDLTCPYKAMLREVRRACGRARARAATSWALAAATFPPVRLARWKTRTQPERDIFRCHPTGGPFLGYRAIGSIGVGVTQEEITTSFLCGALA